MLPENRIINSLWIGKELSPNEILCIKSYLYNGHEFHLYSYNQIRNVPAGTTTLDANIIIPHEVMVSLIWDIKNHAYTIFSDIFRYKLLYELGGWWSDLDAVCIRPYDLKQEYVFIEEQHKGKPDKVCGGVIKTPIHATIMNDCFEHAMELIVDIHNMNWFALGPTLLIKMVNEYHLDKFILPSKQFAPIGYFQVEKWIKPYAIQNDVFSIHLYNDIWNTRNISKNGIYSKTSLLKSLKNKYSVKDNMFNLVKELISEFKNNGIKTGSQIVKDKIWFMYRSFC